MSDAEDEFGFASDEDVPIPYLRRIHDYYQGLGYGAPYRWAHYADVPFTPMKQPVAESRVGLVTTAAPFKPQAGDQGPGAPHNGAAKFFNIYSGDTAAEHDLRISHIAYDRVHTGATDSACWFPLPAMRRAAAAGGIGELAPFFYGAPTNRSHRVTLQQDCTELLKRAQADRLDAVVLLAV